MRLIVNSEREYKIGLCFSLIAHGVLFYFLLFFAAPKWRDFGEPVVYSVTLEGGKSLGGISQLPKDERKQAVAPPKNVSAAEERQSTAVKTEDPKDAEVSLAEKKREAERKIAEEKKKALEEKKALEKKKAADAKKKAEEAKKKAEEERVKAEKQRQQTAAEINKQYQKAMQRYLGESSDAGGKGFGAAKVTGGSGMGGGVLRPPEFFTYRDMLKRTVRQGWHWPDSSSDLRTLVYFEISRAGEIANVSIVTSSGNREYDDSVTRAIYMASPVPPPPDNVYEFFAKVRMEFSPLE